MIHMLLTFAVISLVLGIYFVIDPVQIFTIFLFLLISLAFTTLIFDIILEIIIVTWKRFNEHNNLDR
jgi:ABC-type multidrug transport system permease subunit